MTPIAKLIVWGETQPGILRMRRAGEYRIVGVRTNIISPNDGFSPLREVNTIHAVEEKFS
jgi:hypothetical protein